MTNYTIQFDPTIFATFNNRNIPFSTEDYTITPMREMIARSEAHTLFKVC